MQYIELSNYFVSSGETTPRFCAKEKGVDLGRPPPSTQFTGLSGENLSIDRVWDQERELSRVVRSVDTHTYTEEEECFHRKGRRIVPLEEAHWIVTSRDDDNDDDDVSTRIRFLCLVFLPFPRHFTSSLPPPLFFSRTCVSRNRLATASKDQPRREKESSRKKHGNFLHPFFPSLFLSLSLFFSFSIFSSTSPLLESSFLCASVDGSSPLTSLDICRLLALGK